MEFIYKKVSKDDLRKIMEHCEIDSESKSVPVYKGFRYFSTFDLREDEEANFFLVAINKQSNNVVGVMRIKCYSLGSVEYVSESTKVEGDYFTLISFVDVKEKFKRKGIATNLYRTLNDVLTTEDMLMGTKLSYEGAKAQLGKLRKQLVTKCPVYNSYSDYAEELYEECDW